MVQSSSFGWNAEPNFLLKIGSAAFVRVPKCYNVDMFLFGPWHARSERAIIQKIWHEYQMSKQHQRDKKWFDFLQERLALVPFEGFLEYLNVDGHKDFQRLAVEAMKAQYAQREARYKNREMPMSPPRIGYHFKWPPNDGWQALYAAAPKAGKKRLIQKMKELILACLKRFEDAPILLTCHTDTARVHMEVLVIKYIGKKKLRGFKGIYGGDSDQWHRASLAAIQEKEMPWDVSEWPAYISYELTRELKEATRGWFSECSVQEKSDILGKAAIVYHALRTLVTDETLRNREKTAERLGDLASPDYIKNSEESTQRLARHEFTQWLGEDLPEGSPPPENYLAPVLSRVKAVIQRREEQEKDKERPIPEFDTRRAHRYALSAHQRRRKLRRLTDDEERKLRNKLRKIEKQLEAHRKAAERSPVERESERRPLNDDNDHKHPKKISTKSRTAPDEPQIYYDFYKSRETKDPNGTTVPLKDKDLFLQWFKSRKPTRAELSRMDGPDGFEESLKLTVRIFTGDRDQIAAQFHPPSLEADLKSLEPEL